MVKIRCDGGAVHGPLGFVGLHTFKSVGVKQLGRCVL